MLAAWLTTHMVRTGLTPAQVAADLGVSVGTVQAWLTGRKASEGDNEFARLDTPAKLGGWLRARIAESGCSVRQVAESTEGVSMSTVYNWLRGEHLPPPPTGEEPDRFDLLLSNPRLDLSLRQRLRLDEARRKLTGTSVQAVEPAPAWPARGLPADNRAFTGRNTELKQLDRLLHEYTRDQFTVMCALTGPGGVGKTALAVRWARTRAVKATFTDGCLYLNLNGYADVPPLSSEDALTKMLLQLGVPPRQVPADPDARAAAYQQALSGKRLLLLLDNARAEPQLRPLLPADPQCLAIVTSRNRLPGLAATHPGVAYLPLDALTTVESAALLRKLLGRLAIGAASEEEIDAFAEACGRLPLAIHIAASNYLTYHHARRTSIGAYAQTLTTHHLDHLTAGPTDPDTSLVATMDHSYRHLTGQTQDAYRLLGLHPGPDFTAEAAASLTGLNSEATQSVLRILAQASLLAERGSDRYAFHDLVRDHAAGLAVARDPEADRLAASRRMLDHYLHAADTAARLLNPHLDSIGPEPIPPAVNLTDQRQALSWFENEHAVLLAAIDHAAGLEWDAHTWRFAWSVNEFLDRRGRWHDLAAVGNAALAAARRLGDDTAWTRAHRILARAAIRLGRFEESDAHLSQALGRSRLGDERQQAHIHLNLASVREHQGRHQAALGHARRALALYEAVDHRIGQARALNSVGWYHALLGENDRAMAFCQAALELCDKLDFGYGLAGAQVSLAYIHRHSGDCTEALAYYLQALAGYRELDDRYEAADTLGLLGDLHQSRGDLDAAHGAWQESLDILTELDHPDADRIHAKLAERSSTTQLRGGR